MIPREFMKKYEPISTVQLNGRFKKLTSKEKKDYESYMDYRKSRGLSSESKLKDVFSGVVRLRICAEKPLDKLSLREVMSLTGRIKESKYGDYSKNEAITNLKRFMKWANPSLNLEDIQLIKKPIRMKEIRVDDLPTKEDVEKLIKHESKMFWKALLITQFEGGLRTKEIRFLKWNDVQLNRDGDISEINIFSTKTKEARDVFVKEATFYLKKLKEEQDNLEIRGEYIFRSKTNASKPISRAVVSMWMKRLSKRVLGRNCHNYLLRHARGNSLYQLAKQGKISKDIALTFMGHSKEMSSVYTHDKKDEIKKMLKDQVYQIEEMPEERSIQLEKENQEIRKELKEIRKLMDIDLADLRKKVEENAAQKMKAMLK